MNPEFEILEKIENHPNYLEFMEEYDNIARTNPPTEEEEEVYNESIKYSKLEKNKESRNN